MKNIIHIEFQTGSKEEFLPNFHADFPYIASHVEFDKYIGRFVPWHWHKTVELFYIQSGALEYYTPKGKTIFPTGSGGIINSNVLHMTRPQAEANGTVQLLHIFDPAFIAGEPRSRIEQNYITPLVTSSLELIALFPNNPTQAPLLNTICESFLLSENEFGYELKLRAILSDIWLGFLEMSIPLPEEKNAYNKIDDKIKQMMIYIHEHYADKISISDVSAAAFTSERECFRAFHDYLHMTPTEYIKSYRLQMACRMLAKSQQSITSISHACGLGSSSYFGKSFREHTGCTPIEYRNKWQDIDI